MFLTINVIIFPIYVVEIALLGDFFKNLSLQSIARQIFKVQLLRSFKHHTIRHRNMVETEKEVCLRLQTLNKMSLSRLFLQLETSE